MQKHWESPLPKLLLFLLFSALFFLLRLDTFTYVFAEDYLRLIDPDSYYHLRRILFTFENYPKLLTFDPFLSYPHGDYVPWPPLFDLLSATIAKLFHSTAILPALDMLYFYAAFALIFYVSIKEFGLFTAGITAFLLSAAGILRIYTSFGRIDHHALELLIITASYISFALYYRKKNLSLMLLFTLTVLSAFFNWPGSVIYYPPLFIFVLYELFKRRIAPEIFKGLFVAFHVTAILIAIYLRFTKTDDFPPYSYKFLSGFHRDFCFFVSILFFNIYLTLKSKIKPAIIWISAAVILFGLFHRFIFELFRGFSFVGKTNPLLILAEESSPLFFSRFYSLSEELKRTISLFTPLFLLFPFVFYRYAKKKGFDLVFFYCLFFLLLTFFQLRFGYFFMLGYTIMTAIAIEDICRRFKKALIPIVVILSLFLFYSNYKTAEGRFESPSLYAALKFLKENTPEKEAFLKGKTPYGILASWHLGHYIIELGNRPAVAHNFLGVALHNGEKSFITALFSEREEDVIKIMDESGAPYLFLDNPDSLIVTDWSAISSAPNPYILNKEGLNSKAMTLFLYKLYHYNGVVPAFESTPKYLRLIYENRDIKIFERVRGYRVKIKGDAILKAKIVTPTTTFFYINIGKKTEDGKEFVIPYTVDAPYPVKALEIYLERDGKKIPLNVTEAMVKN